MIHCLYPDCEFKPSEVRLPDGMVNAADPANWIATSVEHQKRQTIDHINHDHDDAHVLIACAHELREVERYMAKTRNAAGAEIEVGEQVRSECVRCGQFVVEDAPAGEPITVAEGVIITGNKFDAEVKPDE